MSADTERWLAELQARFGAVLRMPLSTAGGTLHADVSAYPERAVADLLPSARLTAVGRLGVYHRQYWLRLLHVLQEQYPLTVRLCGAWGFNQHAIAFVSREPPRGCDLGNVVSGFDDFIAQQVQDSPALPRAALLEAARLDAAYRRVFMAPEEPAFRVEADQLAMQRLRLSRALAIVHESWPLLELRAHVFGKPESDAIPLPPALLRRRSWALYRASRGVAQLELEPEQLRLLELLQQHPLGAALGILEAECDATARDGLPERTQRFLAGAVRHGFFV
ncbi:MAG TPA: putative DNA-binding domain-containing protein [Polyangiales bacterium]|nr:putative DNA-binding domain-containing protein [Polyangiales bacterium]